MLYAFLPVWMTYCCMNGMVQVMDQEGENDHLMKAVMRALNSAEEKVLPITQVRPHAFDHTYTSIHTPTIAYQHQHIPTLTSFRLSLRRARRPLFS